MLDIKTKFMQFEYQVKTLLDKINCTEEISLYLERSLPAQIHLQMFEFV